MMLSLLPANGGCILVAKNEVKPEEGIVHWIFSNAG